MRITFAPPRHGWIAITLDGTARRGSDVGPDWLRALADAARAAVASEIPQVVEIFEEPDVLRLPVPRDAALAIWRALRRLETSWDPAGWRYPFPAEAVRALGEVVRAPRRPGDRSRR
jgi:hypothetical protein